MTALLILAIILTGLYFIGIATQVKEGLDLLLLLPLAFVIVVLAICLGQQ